MQMLIISGKTPVTVNCKNTVEGVFHFTYEMDAGGGGVCNSPNSQITACQEPGSQYVDNQVFTMNFAKCPDVTTSSNKSKCRERIDIDGDLTQLANNAASNFITSKTLVSASIPRW